MHHPHQWINYDLAKLISLNQQIEIRIAYTQMSSIQLNH